MNTTRSSILVAAAVLALAAAGCGKEGTPEASTSGGAASDACTSSGTTFTPGTPNITGSPTFDKIKSAGTVRVGVKADQPNIGYKDTSGKRCGFDIEIAQMIAAGLGVDPSKIQYSEIPSANRESAIKGGQIDYYVGTYSITDKRKAVVSFAGPYFVAGQDLLVRKDDTASPARTPCTARRSARRPAPPRSSGSATRSSPSRRTSSSSRPTPSACPSCSTRRSTR